VVLLMQALQTATKVIASRVACAGVDDLGAKLGAGEYTDLLTFSSFQCTT